MSMVCNRRRFLACAAAAVFAGPLAGLSGAQEAPARPNIVVILADDLGYGDISLHGCKDVATPNIDALAANGVRFTNGYVSAPVCSPTRAGLLSGMYQQRHGDEFLVHKPGNDDGLSHKVTTLPQRLREAGYETAHVGKWHLGDDAANHPMERGFDEFYGVLTGGRSYLPMSDEAKKEMLAVPMKGDPRVWEGRKVVSDPLFLTTAFTQRACEIIGQKREKPLFLYLCHTAIHSPVQAQPGFIEKLAHIRDNKRRQLASLIAGLDDGVGQVMRAVEKSGQSRNTLVFFLSDNGGGGTRGVAPNGSLNTPLRGFKGETWEGGIRVPFIASWQGVLPAGSVYEKPVIQMDITATALELAGLTPKPDWKLDGVNLMPYLTGKSDGIPHPTLYWRFYKSFAIREGDWKLVASNEGRGTEVVGPMLFDLSRDRSEEHDLSAQYPQRVQELREKWQQWSEAADRDAASGAEPHRATNERSTRRAK